MKLLLPGLENMSAINNPDFLITMTHISPFQYNTLFHNECKFSLWLHCTTRNSPILSGTVRWGEK